MSDPFQPCEEKFKITQQLIDLSNEYKIPILFSTKSDTVYNAKINPDLHSFQLSITNLENRKDLEPNIPDIESRYQFFKKLKSEGFKVGIRLQPFIPNVTTLDIVKKFKEADHFTIEGIKLVPQNKEQKEYILKLLNLDKNDFKQMGLLNLKPEIRLSLYEPFIDFFKQNNLSYSISDNDLRKISNNGCCCGDHLVQKSTSFNITNMINKYGEYTKEQLDKELKNNKIENCICSQLFSSNRTQGCKTVQEFYDKRFYKKISPFSPLFQYNQI